MIHPAALGMRPPSISIPLSLGVLPLQVQLDGSVRSSGAGLPPWSRLVDDLPELSDVRTKLTDGMGRV